VSAIFWNNVRLPREKRDAAAVAEAERNLVEPLKIADRHLAQHDWFAGESFSFGDIVMGCVFWRYMALDCAKPDIPHVMEWFEALKRRQPYRQWVMVPVGRHAEEWTKYERELG
jgi:glutathione S-transferase